MWKRPLVCTAAGSRGRAWQHASGQIVGVSRARTNAFGIGANFDVGMFLAPLIQAAASIAARSNQPAKGVACRKIQRREGARRVP